MMCPLCASANQAEFSAEVNIHFHGLENIDNPGVLVFPKLLVCLDCGSSLFSIAGAELSQLARRPATREVSTLERRVEETILRRRIPLGA